MQENQSALEVWDFHTTSHGGLLSGNQMGVCWVVWLNPTVGALLSPL